MSKNILSFVGAVPLTIACLQQLPQVNCKNRLGFHRMWRTVGAERAAIQFGQVKLKDLSYDERRLVGNDIRLGHHAAEPHCYLK